MCPLMRAFRPKMQYAGDGPSSMLRTVDRGGPQHRPVRCRSDTTERKRDIRNEQTATCVVYGLSFLLGGVDRFSTGIHAEVNWHGA